MFPIAIICVTLSFESRTLIMLGYSVCSLFCLLLGYCAECFHQGSTSITKQNIATTNAHVHGHCTERMYMYSVHVQ